MSDLVEKVARSIEAEIAKRKGVFDSGDLSRAAIRAVLAHFAEAWNVTDGMALAWHNSNYCDGWSYAELCDQVDGYGMIVKSPIAAAMAAALKEMEPNP